MSTIATVVYGVLLMLGGSTMNFIISIWVYRWQKRADVPEDLSWRISRIEQAFVAHTGITLNGKDYKKEHGR